MNPIELTATDLAAAVREGTVPAVEATQACLDRIAAHDDAIHSFLDLDREGALAAADAIDRRIASGEPVGRLAGVPVALKDNLAVRGRPTTCASRILLTYRPPYDAHVVERLRAEGAVLLGKTNLDEFAMGSSTEHSGVGPTRNPRDTTRAPGGSSGGSAAAVAAGFAPLALGSDTGGSIRQPAGFCGCVGFKPTYGAVSRYGLVAFGSSLDQIGPFARTVRDAALLTECIAGHDPRDATSADRAAPACLDALSGGVEMLRGLRIGVPQEYFAEGIDPQVEARIRGAVEAAAAAGAEIVEVSLPHTKYAAPVYYIVATAEASSNLARYDGAHYGHRTEHADDIVSLFSRSRAEGFGEEVKRRVMLGAYVLSAGYYDAYYLRGLKVRTLMARELDRTFESVDVLFAPTSPTVAFPLGDRTDDPIAMYLSDVFTISANLAGIPAISLPCGEADGLPVGLQVMGARFDDARVLAAAHAVEALLGTGGRIAPLDE